MTTHRDIASSETDPFAPIVAALMKALASNPIAIAEGATGAPYLAAGWHPYNGVTIGDGNDGVIYDFAVHGAVASVVSPVFEDGYEYMLVMSAIDSSGPVDNLFIEAYGETSGSYSTLSNTTLAYTTATDISIRLEFYWPRLTSANIFTNQGISGGSLSPAQKFLHFRARFNTGNIAGGTIRMLRRLAF